MEFFFLTQLFVFFAEPCLKYKSYLWYLVQSTHAEGMKGALFWQAFDSIWQAFDSI